MKANLDSHCIPEEFLDGDICDYEDFLVERRRRMALKVRDWFRML